MNAMTPTERVEAAYDRIESAGRPEIWIHLRPRHDVLAEAAGIDPGLPLAGLVAAVKDNIDVAGLPTTAGAPYVVKQPDRQAPQWTRLLSGLDLLNGYTKN
ncbi:amidase family protein [Streptomyces chartreusis]